VLPEWWHVRADEAERFTRAMLAVLEADLRAAGKPGILKDGGSP